MEPITKPDNTTATDPQHGTSRHGRVVLVVLCLAQFMLIVDVVIVNVALPSIRDDLGLPDGRLQLVAIAYTVTFGSLLIVFGRLGDLRGRHRVFIAGLIIFTVASLATGAAQTEWQLLAGRASQGIGAALASPTALALLTTAFAEGPARNRALGYWGAVGSAGAIAGQLLGGLLTDTIGWRAIFLINVPVGIIAIIAARRYLTDTRSGTIDELSVRGAGLLTGGLVAAVISLTRLADDATSAAGVVLAVVAIGLLAAAALVDRGAAAPLVDRNLIRTRDVGRANMLLAVNAGTVAGALFFTTLYLQSTLDYSPLDVGLAFAPITGLIVVIAPKAGVLASTYGPRRLLTVGFTLVAAGMALLARLPSNGFYLRDVLPPLLLIGVGSGFAYPPTFIAGTTGVADADHGLASGYLNSSQELGAAIGVTVLGAIATATSNIGNDLVAGYRVALLAAAVVVAASMTTIRHLHLQPDPAQPREP